MPTWKPRSSSFLLLGCRTRSAPACIRPVAPCVRLQVDAVGPDIDVVPGGQIRAVASAHSPPPAVVSQPRGSPDGDRFGASRPSSAVERLLEITHRDPAQVEDRRQQCIQAPCPTRPARQNGRGEANAQHSPTAPAPRSRSLTRYCTLTGPDPGLDRSASGPWPCRTRRSRP